MRDGDRDGDRGQHPNWDANGSSGAVPDLPYLSFPIPPISPNREAGKKPQVSPSPALRCWIQSYVNVGGGLPLVVLVRVVR